MPMLKSIKHELLAQNIVKHSGNATSAYQVTYPDSTYDSARSNSYTLIKNGVGFRERVFEIMVNHGRLGLKPAVEKLSDHIASKDERVSLTALQTAFKLYGATDAGVMIDQSQHLSINLSDSSKLSDNQLLEQIRGMLR